MHQLLRANDRVDGAGAPAMRAADAVCFVNNGNQGPRVLLF
jgi:hypothetical protein